MFIWKSLEYLYTLENGFKIEVIPFNFQNLQLNNRLLCTICFYTALKLISWFQYGIKKFRQIILSNLLLFVYKYIWAHKMGSKYINLLIGSIFLTFFCKKNCTTINLDFVPLFELFIWLLNAFPFNYIPNFVSLLGSLLPFIWPWRWMLYYIRTRRIKISQKCNFLKQNF